jgi:hypothetical protein
MCLSAEWSAKLVGVTLPFEVKDCDKISLQHNAEYTIAYLFINISNQNENLRQLVCYVDAFTESGAKCSEIFTGNLHFSQIHT